MFRSEIGSGFEDPGGTPPQRNPRIPPPPPPPGKDCSSFIRPRVQKRIKVTKVSLRSQRFEFGPECFALNLTLEQMKQ